MSEQHNKDIDGQPSSKRLWGGRMLRVGMIMGIVLFVSGLVMAILNKEFNYALPMELTWTFLGAGLGSFGLTLNERWGKQKPK